MPDTHIHIHVQGDSAAIESKLDVLIALIQQSIEQEKQQMADLSSIQDQVTQQTTVVQSVTTLLTSIAQQLRDAATDPAAVQALADQIESNNQALSDAVAANTPGA